MTYYNFYGHIYQYTTIMLEVPPHCSSGSKLCPDSIYLKVKAALCGDFNIVIIIVLNFLLQGTY